MTTPDIRWIQRPDNFQRALASLQRGIGLSLSRSLSELGELGLIQAFEFTHELSWLLLKDFLEDQGVAGISGSRDAVRKAMIRGRNLTSHTYNPAVAREIADLIVHRYCPAFQQLSGVMLGRVSSR